MPLISCPECQAQISDQAVVCIRCGYPLIKIPEKTVSTIDNNLINDSSYCSNINYSKPTKTEDHQTSQFDISENKNKLIQPIISCPNCKCEDWKLASLIHRDGFNFTQSVSTGVGVSPNGIGIGTSKSGGTSQTALSSLAAPPKNPRNDYIQGMGMIGALICGGIGYLIGGFSSMLGGIFLGTIAGSIFGAMIPNTVYELQYDNWQKVIMCLRCGTFYLPPK